MATVRLNAASSTTPEDRKKAFLLGCASLRIANLLSPGSGGEHVIEITGNTVPLLDESEKVSSSRHHRKREAKGMEDHEQAKRAKVPVTFPFNRPAAMFVMTGWLYLVLLLLAPMYLLLICYLIPQTVVFTPVVSVGELNGDSIFIIKGSDTQTLQLEADTPPAPPTGSVWQKSFLDPHKMKLSYTPRPPTPIVHKHVLQKVAPSKNMTAILLAHEERQRRSLHLSTGIRVNRDLLGVLRGTFQDAKSKYENLQSEVMTQASNVENLFTGLHAESLIGRKTRSVNDVGRVKLAPGSYLMFRMTRSLTDAVKKGYNPGRDAVTFISTTDKMAPLVNYKNQTGNEVLEEKNKATVSKPDDTLKATVMATVPMEEWKDPAQDPVVNNGMKKKCHYSEMHMIKSILGDNTALAVSENDAGKVGEENEEMTGDWKEIKGEKAIAENSVGKEEKVGEVVKVEKASYEESDKGEKGESTDPEGVKAADTYDSTEGENKI